MSMGIKAELHKVRTVFIYEQTRIHLDEVENLGNFMELEVVFSGNSKIFQVCLREDQTVEDGEKIAYEIMEKLEIPKTALLSGAYVDAVKKMEDLKV